MSELHQVTFTKTEKGHTLTFVCLGDETSACHQYPECSCDYWTNDHEHPKVPHVDCWLVSWFTNDGDGSCYDGEDQIDDCICSNSDHCPPTSRTGEIETWFEDECVFWQFEASQ